MAAKIAREGNYELFRSTGGQQVLSLAGHQFLLTEGPKGEDMVMSRGDFEKDEVLDSGEYRYVEFEGDEFPQDPHLFLRRNGHFQVVIFPEGLPTMKGTARELIAGGDKVGVDEVETYIQSLQEGSGGERQRQSQLQSFSEVTQLLGGMGFPAEKWQIIEFAQSRQVSDELINELKAVEDGNYQSLKELIDELKDNVRAERLDIEDYEERSAEELIEMLEAMEPAELRELEDYERRHKDRNEVIDAIERRLGH